MYLLNSKGDGASSIPNKVLGVFLTAAYMVVKGKIFVKAVKSWREAFYKLLQSTRFSILKHNQVFKTVKYLLDMVKPQVKKR